MHNGNITIRALHDGLADAVGRANHGYERLHISRNNQPVSGFVGPDDLKQLELLREISDYCAAKPAEFEQDAHPTGCKELADESYAGRIPVARRHEQHK